MKVSGNDKDTIASSSTFLLHYRQHAFILDDRRHISGKMFGKLSLSWNHNSFDAHNGSVVVKGDVAVKLLYTKRFLNETKFCGRTHVTLVLNLFPIIPVLQPIDPGSWRKQLFLKAPQHRLRKREYGLYGLMFVENVRRYIKSTRVHIYPGGQIWQFIVRI